MAPQPAVLGIERARHIHRRRRDHDFVPGRELGDHVTAVRQDFEVLEEGGVQQRLGRLPMLGWDDLLEVTAPQLRNRQSGAEVRVVPAECSASASAITSSMSMAIRSRRVLARRRSAAIFRRTIADTSVMATMFAAMTAMAPFSTPYTSHRPEPLRYMASMARDRSRPPWRRTRTSCGRNDSVVTSAPPVPTIVLRVWEDIKTLFRVPGVLEVPRGSASTFESVEALEPMERRTSGSPRTRNLWNLWNLWNLSNLWNLWNLWNP